MELTPKAQTAELIRQSKKILLLTHSSPDGDALGSVLAMKLILQKMGKEADIVVNEDIPQVCSFLPGFQQIKKELAVSNDIIITVDTHSTGEDLRLGHKKLTEQHQVQIIISPQHGRLLPEDVAISHAHPKYDLVMFLDCSAIERIGDWHRQLQDLFYETPTVSIDHHATNSYFAKVNWVDMTSTSTAEMLVSLIESLGRNDNMFEADVATCLLTGLITDTGSFQNVSTTPKSLTVAAQLVAAGARQQEIVDKLFRTKSLSTLKLWGKVLSKIQENTEGKFVWASVSAEELLSVGANQHDVKSSGLIDELLKSVDNADFVVMLSEDDTYVHVSMRSVKQGYDVSRIASAMGGGGHVAAAGFEIEGHLAQKESQIISEITRLAKDPKTEPIALTA